MQTVLAGPDGTSPAVDQITQQPLTMEELIRRRGLMVTGGLHSVYPQQGSDPTAASASAGPSGMPMPIAKGGGVPAALAARAGASGVSSAGAGGGNVTSTVAPNASGIANSDATSDMDIPPWLVGAPIAAVLAYRAWKARGGVGEPPMSGSTAMTTGQRVSMMEGEVMPPTSAANAVIDGEFSEVPEQRALPAPPQRLPSNIASDGMAALEAASEQPKAQTSAARALADRKAKARQKQATAAQGSTSTATSPPNRYNPNPKKGVVRGYQMKPDAKTTRYDEKGRKIMSQNDVVSRLAAQKAARKIAGKVIR